MFLRLFLTLLLMAGLTVDFHTMSLSFGTAAYACSDDDWGDDDGWDECVYDSHDFASDYYTDIDGDYNPWDGDNPFTREIEEGRDYTDDDDDCTFCDMHTVDDFIYYIESGEAGRDGIDGHVWNDNGHTYDEHDLLGDVENSEGNYGGEPNSDSADDASVSQNQESTSNTEDDDGGKRPEGWGIHGTIAEGKVIDDIVVNGHKDDNNDNDDKDRQPDFGHFPDEPINNDDPYEGNVDPSDGTISEQDPLEPKEEEDEECECQFGECDICGLCLPGVEKRSSNGKSKSCETCPGHPTMPDCDSITKYTGLLINTTEYKAALESMRTLSNSGTSACRLLFDNGIDEQNGLSRNLSVGDTYSDLGSAMSAKKSSEDVVGVVYSVGEGQHMLTDRQMLDLVKYSTRGFSTAYVVDGSHVYAVRFENFNMSQTYLSKYEGYILDDGEFDSRTGAGKVYSDSREVVDGVLEAKSAMYNYMDISLSLLQSNTSDNGDLLFSKINSCYSLETEEVYTETCGEGGGK